jgi:hypothetical protein
VGWFGRKKHPGTSWAGAPEVDAAEQHWHHAALCDHKDFTVTREEWRGTKCVRRHNACTACEHTWVNEY